MALAESERIDQLLTKDAGNIVTAALFVKDYETKKHSERVAKYSREIAIRYGLTEEAEIIKNHSVIGEDILKNLNATLGDAAKVVCSHHERYDGKGYPDGLAGEDIPLASRIIAVAEAYDAMTNCSYSFKAPLSKAQAREEIEDNSGTQFDPTIAKIMLAAVSFSLLSRKHS